MAVPKRKTAAGTVTLDTFLEHLSKDLALAATDPDALEGAHATTTGNPINLGPRVPEATDWANKQIANATAAGERWLANVQRPTKDPKAEALRANARYKGEMAKVLTEDRFAKGVQKIDLDEMMATIVAGGSGQFTSGVERRRGKIGRVVGDLRAQVLALANNLDKLPIDTPEQREAKMIAAKRGMEAIGRARRGS